MDTLGKAKLPLTMSADRHTFNGAWWPQSRVLSDELVGLFAAWLSEAGDISRVVVSVLDWDDRPATVAIRRRRGLVKVVLLAADTAHQLVLLMLEGHRHLLAVVRWGATKRTVARFMGAASRKAPSLVRWRPDALSRSPATSTVLEGRPPRSKGRGLDRVGLPPTPWGFDACDVRSLAMRSHPAPSSRRLLR